MELLYVGNVFCSEGGRMNSVSKFKKIKQILRDLYEGSRKEDYFQHTLRVVKMCEQIGKEEEANMDILIPACYLHDVGRLISDDLKGHIQKGLILTQLILETLDYNEHTISAILTAIKHHNIDSKDPETLEGKILFDADKLELVGKFGMALWFKSSGNMSLKDACTRYLGLANMVKEQRRSLFYTQSAIKLGHRSFLESIWFCRKVLSRLSKSDD